MAKTQSKKGSVIMEYLESSYQELRKVAWPTRSQAVRVTFLVLGFLVVMALVIGALDYVFGFGHRALLDFGSSVRPPAAAEETAPVQNPAPVENTVNVKDVTAETADGGKISVEAIPVDSTADNSSN